MSTPRLQTLRILNSRRFKRYFRMIYNIRKEQVQISQELTDEAVFGVGVKFVINVLTQDWPAKLMTKYVVELLDVEPIAEKLRNWRAPDNKNILHFACMTVNKEIIERVVLTLGEEFIHQHDNAGTYPISLLLSNQQSNLPQDICHLINLLSTNNVAPLIQIKDKTINLFKTKQYYIARGIPQWQTIVNAIDLFAKHQIFTDDDKNLILKEFEALVGNFNDPGISKVMAHTIMTIGMPPEYMTCIFDRIIHRSSLLQHTLNWNPDLLDYILRHKTPRNHSKGFKFADFMGHVFNKLPNEHYVHLFMTTLKMFEPSTFEPLQRQFEKRNFHGIQIISLLLKQVKYVPKQYLHLFKPYEASWVYGRVFESGTPSMFPIEELPAEMISHVISFLSHQSTTALSLVNKQFNTTINSSTIWRDKYYKYFPLDNLVKDAFSAENNPHKTFYSKYKNKFHRSLANAQLHARSPPPGGFASLELKDNTLVYCSTHYLAVCNISDFTVTRRAINKPSSARIWNDIVFVYTSQGVELLSRDGLTTVRYFETPVPSTIKDTFAVNNEWLVTPRCVYDWTRGQLVSTWLNRIDQIILRGNVFYGISSSGLVIKDVRENKQVGNLDMDVAAMGPVSINKYGNLLYFAGSEIETYDLRFLRKLAMAPFRHDVEDFKIIDLVSMNVWTSTMVWDLIDNKWNSVPKKLMECTTPMAVCNGKEIVYSGGDTLYKIKLAGSSYFPYGDFKCQYLSSPYKGYDYGFE